MRPNARAVAFLAAVFAPAVVVAQGALDGLPIVAIRFERYNIFDTSNPKTDAWLYRAANSLHIVSKERFIRANLLFREGDPYSESLAAESARILRQIDQMNPVEITAHRVEGGVEVTVETHDKWSLQVGGDFDSFGSRSEFGLGITEENLLGLGKAVSVDYSNREERSAFSYRYYDPNLFFSRWQVELIHADLSDGRVDEFEIGRPFYSLATQWAWGGEARRERLIETLYADAEPAVSGGRRTELVEAWCGARLPGAGRATRRLIFGWEYRSDLYDNWRQESTGLPYPEPEGLTISGPSLGLQVIADRFLVVTGFESWTAQEDISLGPDFSASTVISHPTFGGDSWRLPFTSRLHAGVRRGPWLVLADVWTSGRLQDGGTANLVSGFQISAGQLGSRGWQARLLTEDSNGLDLDRQLTLGADIGLRGWEPDTFDGTGRALLNLQWRTMLMEEVFGLFSFGVLIFADAGATWDPRVGNDTDGVKVDAGVGLLFDIPRLSRANLLRIDVAVPDDGSGPVISLSTSSIFRIPRAKRWVY